MGAKWVPGMRSVPAFIVSTWCRGGQGFEAQDLKGVGSGPLVVCPCLLSALSLCLWCITLEYGSISRFKGVSSGFWGFRVGLCCLGGLRGLWGFLCACGVRRLYDLWRVCLRFSSFAPMFAFLFLSLPCLLSFVLLWSGCLCLSSCIVFVVSFSLADYAQKERAQGFCSLRPLFVCCGLYYLVAALYSSYSSGVSPFIS